MVNSMALAFIVVLMVNHIMGLGTKIKRMEQVPTSIEKVTNIRVISFPTNLRSFHGSGTLTFKAGGYC